MKGITNTSEYSTVSKGETAIISLKSNQGSDSNLIGKKITIAYSNSYIEHTWNGEAITVEIPINIEYTVSVEAIEGYKNPQSQTFTSMSGGVRQIDFEYSTTILTIEITSNQSDALSSLTVVVNHNDKDYQLEFTGKESKTINIPTDSNYSITYPEITDYTTPTKVTETATGNSIKKTGEYKATKLTVVRDSNQSESLGNSTATVNYNSKNKQVSYTGSETSKVIMIPFGVNYNITFSAVTGYKTPGNITGTANQTTQTAQTGTYQSEFLTVNVAGASGYTITVSGQGSQTTSPKVYKIPFGTSYNISASSVKGYNTPATQSFTANQVSRSVTMTYTKIANGVYIAYSNGTLGPTSGSAASAVGIAVVSDKCSFIIDKNNQTSDNRMWSSQSKDLSLTNHTSESQVKTDYNGEHNTDVIMSEDTKNVAAKYCRSKSITFGTTRNGYLGAGGEWWTIYNNWDTISSALSKIGGAALNVYEWTSTEFSSDDAWYLSKGGGYLCSGYKVSASLAVRPLYSL